MFLSSAGKGGRGKGFRRSSGLCSSSQSKSTEGGSDFHSYNERERVVDAAASHPPIGHGLELGSLLVKGLGIDITPAKEPPANRPCS